MYRSGGSLDKEIIAAAYCPEMQKFILDFPLTNEGIKMKLTATLSLVLALSASLSYAQSGDMKESETKKNMDMQKCMEMKNGDMKGMDMKNMDMKDMDSEKCKAMMSGSGKDNPPVKEGKTMTHKAVAVVQKMDFANGKVTLAHDAVKTLEWPAMTMVFSVKDKMMLNKLTVGQKINIDFVHQSSDYIITAIK